MKTKKILRAMLAMLSLMVFSGCGRSSEQISVDVKPVVEKIIRSKLGMDSSCTRLLDIRTVDRNHYTATAEVQYYENELMKKLNAKTTELLKISIAYDGDTVVVRIEQ